ncbi:hypothetical protein BN977_03043 [Mycolicibacterium cosmeticum]|uniref:Uncharacterized protein n=1 Tax=Mycolicibacterium cosmeticum TaxID=258533 RepID=W9AR28_MYCCO|nr:hypothetical protein BN977_03043 [Mycolicibacterium cosmeticum]
MPPACGGAISAGRTAQRNRLRYKLFDAYANSVPFRREPPMARPSAHRKSTSALRRRRRAGPSDGPSPAIRVMARKNVPALHYRRAFHPKKIPAPNSPAESPSIWFGHCTSTYIVSPDCGDAPERSGLFTATTVHEDSGLVSKPLTQLICTRYPWACRSAMTASAPAACAAGAPAHAARAARTADPLPTQCPRTSSRIVPKPLQRNAFATDDDAPSRAARARYRGYRLVERPPGH